VGVGGNKLSYRHRRLILAYLWTTSLDILGDDDSGGGCGGGWRWRDAQPPGNAKQRLPTRGAPPSEPRDLAQIWRLVEGWAPTTALGGPTYLISRLQNGVAIAPQPQRAPAHYPYRRCAMRSAPLGSRPCAGLPGHCAPRRPRETPGACACYLLAS
jgi:hypothetical protein